MPDRSRPPGPGAGFLGVREDGRHEGGCRHESFHGEDSDLDPDPGFTASFGREALGSPSKCPASRYRYSFSASRSSCSSSQRRAAGASTIVLQGSSALTVGAVIRALGSPSEDWPAIDVPRNRFDASGPPADRFMKMLSGLWHPLGPFPRRRLSRPTERRRSSRVRPVLG